MKCLRSKILNYIYTVSYKFFLVFGIFSFLLVSACNQDYKGNQQAESLEIYTCPMHPQIVRNAPGKCPICGMDLVPMAANKELHVDSSIVSLAKPLPV